MTLTFNSRASMPDLHDMHTPQCGGNLLVRCAIVNHREGVRREFSLAPDRPRPVSLPVTMDGVVP